MSDDSGVPTGGPTAPGDAPGGAASGIPQEIRQWAMFCHLGGLAGFVIPFGSIIAPLVLWQMKKEQHPFVDDQGREALNFQITATIVIFGLGVLAVALSFVLIGFLLIPVVLAASVAVLVYTIIAGLKANEGVAYRYPFTLRLVK